MRPTRIAVAAGSSQARVELAGGAIVPRLIERGPRSARIALVAGGALLLGGDRIEITVTVGTGCTLELEDIGGTVAYDADGVASFWDVDVTVGADARILWASLPLIVSSGAEVRRRTRIRLAQGAVALVRESLVLGRSGELGGQVHTRISITDADGPALEEALEVDGSRPVPGVLGGHRVLDSIVCVGLRPSRVSVLGGTVMTLDVPGSVARFLGSAAHTSTLAPVWDEWSAGILEEERSRGGVFS